MTSFAVKLGVTRQTLYSIIKAPSYPTLGKIATANDVPLWQLFEGTEGMEKEYGAGGGAGACGAKCPHCGGALNIRVE